MSKGLYIHIPFCKYICSYCDFGKKYILNQPVDEYVDALCTELDMYKPFADINSIYIGGGTPSSLNLVQLTKLLSTIQELTVENQIIEYSFEMNPDDINEEILELLRKFGINRLSVGAQTLNDEILIKLNRKHSAADVKNGVELAKQYFENVSVDFIFNLPNQTKADIDQCLLFIEQYDLNHISYYGLIFEEHTILATEEHKYWTEDYESQMYSYIQTKLAEIGLESYEISNYSKPGYQSYHNIHYWVRDQYYGVGLSASGQLDDYRYTNTYSLKQYIKSLSNRKLPIKDREQLTTEDEVFEKVMLGLRYYNFVQLNSEIVTYINQTEFLADKFDISENSVRLKPEFYYISNQIILDIIERIEC